MVLNQSRLARNRVENDAQRGGAERTDTGLELGRIEGPRISAGGQLGCDLLGDEVRILKCRLMIGRHENRRDRRGNT